MATSLAIAAPAALLAAAAYVNAKTQLGNDYTLITGLIGSTLAVAWKQRCDKVNIFYVLEERALAQSSANHPGLMYEGRTWTYKEIYDIVLRYATWLRTRYAVAPREVVAMDFMNSPVFVFLWLGIWSIGATPAFINYNLTGKALLHSVQSSTARILFVDEEIRSSVTDEIIATLASSSDGKVPVRTQVFTPAILEEIMKCDASRPPDSARGGVAGTDMAILIYTSGTTGLPKPAVVSWQKCISCGFFMPYWIGMKKTDRYYTCMPLYHSSAAILAFCTSLFCGSTLVLGHRFSTKTFWPEVRQHRATIIQYVGETCRYLLSAPPQIDASTGANLDRAHSVTKAFGNGLRPDVWERFKTRFGIETIAEFYAATEAPSASWNLSSNSFSTGAIGRFGTLAGRILSKTAVIVEVDWTTEAPLRTGPHMFCKRAQPGEPGELLFAIPPEDVTQKFQGYFNNPAASEGKILRNVLANGDAFFRSGDVIRWDDEGRWWFCDRIGDTFRWKSENVSTTEVSEALGTHPNVLEANVYGVQIPNHDGRAGCAAILFQSPAEQSVLTDLAAHAKARLPKFAVPNFIRVVREVKTTGNNKQQKAVLRNEGVRPGGVGGDQIFWLHGDRYVPFDDRAWEQLQLGKAKL